MINTFPAIVLTPASPSPAVPATPPRLPLTLGIRCPPPDDRIYNANSYHPGFVRITRVMPRLVECVTLLFQPERRCVPPGADGTWGYPADEFQWQTEPNPQGIAGLPQRMKHAAFERLYGDYIPWDGEPKRYTCHPPSIIVTFHPDGRMEQDFETPGSVDFHAPKLAASVRKCVGNALFDRTCLDSLGYLPRRLIVRFMAVSHLLSEHYLILRHETDMAFLRLTFGAIIYPS